VLFSYFSFLPQISQLPPVSPRDVHGTVSPVIRGRPLEPPLSRRQTDGANGSTPPETDRPIYWFVLLEQSIDAGDLEAAALAQRELKRLGVTVRYGRPSPRRPQRGGRHGK